LVRAVLVPLLGAKWTDIHWIIIKVQVTIHGSTQRGKDVLWMLLGIETGPPTTSRYLWIL